MHSSNFLALRRTSTCCQSRRPGAPRKPTSVQVPRRLTTRCAAALPKLSLSETSLMALVISKRLELASSSHKILTSLSVRSRTRRFVFNLRRESSFVPWMKLEERHQRNSPRASVRLSGPCKTRWPTVSFISFEWMGSKSSYVLLTEIVLFRISVSLPLLGMEIGRRKTRMWSRLTPGQE